MSKKIEDENMNLSLAASQEDEEEIDLVEIGYLLLQHIVEIIGCLITGLVIAAVATKLFIAPKYQSTARMYVVSSSSNSVVDLSSLQIGSSLTGDYTELITSRTVLEEVISDLNLDMEYTELEDEITISNPSDTRVLDITVTDTDPQLAADIVNTLADKAKTYITKVMNTQTPNVFEEGIVPEKKSSPSTVKNGLIGGFLFAFAYIAYLVIKHITNDTFVTPEDVQRVYGVQPLASIPETKSKKSKKGGKKK